MSKKTKSKSGLLGRVIRRFFLVLFTLVLLLVVGLSLVANLIFNGPSPTARDILTMTLLEPSATKWIPGVFMDDAVVDKIRNAGQDEIVEDIADVGAIIINRGENTAGSDEWAAYPDGIIIESYQGKTFNAHIMLIRDPSRVYLGLSSYTGFAESIPGKRPNHAMEEENAVAAINGGAFNDDGSSKAAVGSMPAGVTIHDGQVVSNGYTGYLPQKKGFAGFTNEDKLVVARSMTAEQARELGIRDGCEFGPVLVVNGEPNQETYSANDGLNPRTAIGQRQDGTVVFVCADGRQAGSLGASFRDMVDILIQYGAYNACAMDGGSSTIMLYRDTYGLYGNPGEIVQVSSYSALQSEPRKMPDFWLVRPTE